MEILHYLFQEDATITPTTSTECVEAVTRTCQLLTTVMHLHVTPHGYLHIWHWCAEAYTEQRVGFLIQDSQGESQFLFMHKTTLSLAVP